MTFGEKLQQLRRRQGWSQEELAAQIPISRQAVSKWESGAAMPDTENVVAISRLFGVSTDYLLHDDYAGDQDIPAVKDREAALKKRHKRDMVMMVLIGVQALSLFWQLAGSLIYQNHLIPLLGMTAHIMTIIGFEAGFRYFQRDAEADTEALSCRRTFYRVSVWLVSLFPCAALTQVFWALYPRPYSSFTAFLSPLVLYLPFCVAVTLLLRPRGAAGKEA